jgi:type I restriction-modification system DNA methylase subunit
MRNDHGLENAIEAMGAGSGKSFADLFGDFLEMSLAMLCNNPSERQRMLLQRTLADDRKRADFISVLKAYGEAADDYHDPLGDMFMEKISHGQNGQFFTPEHICDSMARIAEPRGETLCDPCCGSGRFMLAGLKVARENGKEPVIYANDLSYTCSQMTLLNLLVNCARGEVSCGNSLLMDVDNFRFFRIDRVMMPNGSYVSTYWQYTTADVGEVDMLRNEWRKKMLGNGLWVEVIPKEHDEKAVEEDASVSNCEQETENGHLTAVPKAMQLELDLF